VSAGRAGEAKHMTAKMDKTFVGFGFGPIQSGLFLFESYMSGHFRRFVVAEVDANLVAAVRASGGSYHINVARKDRIDRFDLHGVEIYDPADAGDRRRLVEAVARSDEMATCLPSVDSYDAEGGTGVASILAEGLALRDRSLPTVIYAAENHNRAAEILAERIGGRSADAAIRDVLTLNTVIGKMSGVIADEEVIRRMRLTTITPGIPRAILIEQFNRILISRIRLKGFRRGIDVFIEKDDLLPFEEAKLYGHNAIHALIAYLADLRGLATVADAGRDREIMHLAHKAFVSESGRALIRRHRDLGDPLFTPNGYRAYAEDLLERMTNPNLNDRVSRVGRDPVRKLGFDDRLYGTMRIALAGGIEPATLALGAAAGLCFMIRRRDELERPPRHLPKSDADLHEKSLRKLLSELWGRQRDEHAEALVSLTWEALRTLRSGGWC
jgi:mannitol-1-phosphate 5-dehydrogenase